MANLIKPSAKVIVVPREGELEITLNINITIDGKIEANSENAVVTVQSDQLTKNSMQEEKAPYIIPDFTTGTKLNFGKKE